jgi:hypothetical protein
VTQPTFTSSNLGASLPQRQPLGLVLVPALEQPAAENSMLASLLPPMRAAAPLASWH